EQYSGIEAYRGGGSEELVADAPGRTGVEGFAVKRVAEALDADADRGTADGEQRAEIARSSVELGVIADDGDLGVSRARPDVNSGEIRRGQDQRVGEEVVEPSAVAADDHDVGDGAVACGNECELEVGGV